VNTFTAVSFQICVMDQGNDLTGRNLLLGSCIIGPEEEGQEREHWFELTNPKSNVVSMWHSIK